MIQSVREADTLAAEWQLPREWERRVGPETLRGRHHPKRFSLGLHPVSLGKTKEMGWNRQHQPKVQQDKSASSSQPKPTPGRGWNPAPTRGSEERGGAGGGRRKGSSRTPTPTAGGKPPVCRVIYCEIITRPGGGWRNVVRLAETVTAGRRGRRPLQGWCSSRVRAKNAKFPCRGGAPAPSRVGFRGLRRILG